MEKIAILLSTYNGDRYLKEQLDSLFNQTYKDWILYIRDDGSTDSTLRIIEKYINTNSNIFLIKDSKEHRGVLGSFLYLLENVHSEYYMFCDQDDVWLPNKIETSYSEILNLENGNVNIPALTFTDLCVVDETLSIISKSMWKYTRLDRVMSSKYLYVSPYITGCTMMFNNSARLCSLKYRKHATMHDSMLALSVIHNGGRIKSISDSLIYYRQHNCNVLGISMFNNSIVKRMKNIKNILNVNYSYYLFVNCHTNISIMKFITLKIEAAIKIRSISTIK